MMDMISSSMRNFLHNKYAPGKRIALIEMND